MSSLCHELHRFVNGLPVLNFPFVAHDIPSDGLYILFEKGECAHGTSRIVRVGIHTGDGQLRSRLKQHFMKENKDRSIFRKNIGRALLARDNDPFLAQWNLDLTTRKARERLSAEVDPRKQEAVEHAVSAYIRDSFCFVTIPVSDQRRRREFESKIISTVSLCPECEPSDAWLGNHSPKAKIRESGLWLVNELYKQPLTRDELGKLAEFAGPPVRRNRRETL